MGWRKLLFPNDRPLGFGFLVIPLLILGAALIMSSVQWFRTAEAKAAMFASPAPIDGARAYGYLKQICEIGPRIAGSEANTRQRKLVADHFTKMGAKVSEQPFTTQHPLTGKRVDMANLVGSWYPDRVHRIVIGAHYDTRPQPDQERTAARRKLPFLGANDGASGVALLMEIAHHLVDLKTDWGVDLVLFDGEELVYGNNPRYGDYFLGSKEFGRVYSDQVDRHLTDKRYQKGIVLDMVGGSNLQILQEPNSLNLAPEIVQEVWTIARQLKSKAFRTREGREVLDDHLALNDARIPTIDLIDFEYKYWHKADDLPEKCSAESLAEVGRVVTAWLALPIGTTQR
jgi:glutaminyl-peptide cyclotransferase